ncbi:hypothetical protein [Puia sp.]|jgi:energy-coupling factor transporter ATP-binding protein EcfA2|uniref:McrB family protein n=1 Tax=Puia sp. TaxID=2045100 RepID=UPI002F3EC4C5
MLISLEGHTVSLTKNGYQKLWELIRKYPRNQILDHLDEHFPSPAQYRPQALKMLGGDVATEALPAVWDEVKEYDDETIRALLAISIVFSHKTLIKLFSRPAAQGWMGEIKRSDFEQRKEYTNLAYALHALGVAIDVRQNSLSVQYNWLKIFGIRNLGPLVKKVITAQLSRMGYTSLELSGDGFYNQADEFHFPAIFGLQLPDFKDWLEKGIEPFPRAEPKAFLPGQNGMPPGRYMPSPKPTPTFSNLPIVRNWLFNTFFTDLEKAFREASLLINPWLQRRFVASLLTKRFVLLTGLSGSGKTKLAQAFAHWLCADASQIALIPVGADWMTREPLLGYPDALRAGEYCHPDNGALNLILEAAKPGNAQKPYFLILDEMNLSRVERYFADFLSAMESNEDIPLHPGSAVWAHSTTPATTPLPPNLFIIGTVNIDETTHMFSPKVLDRANVIEFKIGAAELAAFLNNPEPPNLEKIRSQGGSYAEGFLQVAKGKAPPLADGPAIRQALLNFFTELQLIGGEFGFRPAAEIYRFAGIMHQFIDEKVPEISTDEIIDAAVLQKLLPKLHGSRLILEPVLKTLGALCLNDKNDFAGIVSALWEPEPEIAGKLRFPLSFAKIVSMGRRLVQNGFTSYAEA